MYWDNLPNIKPLAVGKNEIPALIAALQKRNLDECMYKGLEYAKSANQYIDFVILEKPINQRIIRNMAVNVEEIITAMIYHGKQEPELRKFCTNIGVGFDDVVNTLDEYDVLQHHDKQRGLKLNNLSI